MNFMLKISSVFFPFNLFSLAAYENDKQTIFTSYMKKYEKLFYLGKTKVLRTLKW